MKILVVSDSHQQKTNLKKAFTAAAAEGAELFIFLGDGIEDLKQVETQIPVYGVFGNMDKGEGEKEKVIEVAGYRVLLIHGNQLGYQQNFEQFLKGRTIDILLYGHTHKQDMSVVKINGHDIGIYNPGSIAKGNYGILELTPSKVHFEMRRL